MGGTTVTGFTGVARPLLVRTPWSRQSQTGGRGALMEAGWINVNTVDALFMQKSGSQYCVGYNATIVFKGHQ